MDTHIEHSWKQALKTEFTQPYWRDLAAFIQKEYLSANIYPAQQHIFKAFELTPFDAVRVVILGQDPYHREGQAHGLCFSVQDGAPIPPSLKNIYKEIVSDMGELQYNTGDLTTWAEQGVLLLNSTLTVRAGEAGSHQHHGWETFTDALISTLSDQKEHLVFMLWGNYARQKKYLIDTQKHLVLEAPHPSPLAAYTGFFGCGHFSKANDYLRKWDRKEIVW